MDTESIAIGKKLSEIRQIIDGELSIYQTQVKLCHEQLNKLKSMEERVKHKVSTLKIKLKSINAKATIQNMPDDNLRKSAKQYLKLIKQQLATTPIDEYKSIVILNKNYTDIDNKYNQIEQIIKEARSYEHQSMNFGIKKSQYKASAKCAIDLNLGSDALIDESKQPNKKKIVSTPNGISSVVKPMYNASELGIIATPIRKKRKIKSITLYQPNKLNKRNKYVLSTLPQNNYQSHANKSTKMQKKLSSSLCTKNKLSISGFVSQMPIIYQPNIVMQNECHEVSINGRLIDENLISMICDSPAVFFKVYKCYDQNKLESPHFQEMKNQIESIAIKWMGKTKASIAAIPLAGLIGYLKKHKLKLAPESALGIICSLGNSNIETLYPLSSEHPEYVLSALMVLQGTLYKENKNMDTFPNQFKTSQIIDILKKLKLYNIGAFINILIMLSQDPLFSKECYESIESFCQGENVSCEWEKLFPENRINVQHYIKLISSKANAFVDINTYIQIVPLLLGVKICYTLFKLKSGQLFSSVYTNEDIPGYTSQIGFGCKTPIYIINIENQYFFAEKASENGQCSEFLCSYNNSLKFGKYDFIERFLSVNKKSGNIDEHTQIVCPQCSKMVKYGYHFIVGSGVTDLINHLKEELNKAYPNNKY